MDVNIMIENSIETTVLGGFPSVHVIRVAYAWITLFILVSQFHFERMRSPIEEC